MAEHQLGISPIVHVLERVIKSLVDGYQMLLQNLKKCNLIHTMDLRVSALV